MKRKITLLALLFVTLSNYAQQSSISGYLDDGGRSIAKDIIKTDLPEYFKANIPIIWEHRFNDWMAVQLGVGLLTNSFFRPIYTPRYSVDDNTMYAGLNGGYSLLISPVFYKNGFESLHMELPFKYHHYFGKAVSYEFNCTIGKQWFLSRRIALDIDLGVGICFEKSLDGTSYIYDPEINNTDKFGGEGIRLIFPLSVKLGYIL